MSLFGLVQSLCYDSSYPRHVAMSFGQIWSIENPFKINCGFHPQPHRREMAAYDNYKRQIFMARYDFNDFKIIVRSSKYN